MADQEDQLLSSPRSDQPLQTDSVVFRPEYAETHTDADIEIHPGAYTAVIVSAFGGVSFATGRKVHPFLMLLLVAPLFMIQMTMIIALNLDTDFMRGIRMHDKTLGDIGNPSNLIRVKCLMVAVVQLSCFTIMLSNVRFGVFLLNPVSWFQVSHPSVQEWIGNDSSEVSSFTQAIFHPIFLAIPSMIAVCCRFCVSYMVCVDSMSIIFASRSMTDCMFNALVLNFITDLQPIYWDFVSTVFTLNSIDGFTFTVRDKVTKLLEDIREGWDTPENIEKRLKDLDQTQSKTQIVKIVATYVPVLARGYGFRRVENAIAFAVLGGIYLQQMFLSIFALMTNVLPVTRDMCSLWRWHAGKAAYLKIAGPATVRFLDAVTFVSLQLDETLKNLPNGSCQLSNQSTMGTMWGIYDRMKSSDRWAMISSGDYTYVESVRNNSKYDIFPHLVENNGWTGFDFKLGVCIVAAIVVVPQSKSIIDLFHQMHEHITTPRKASTPQARETTAAPGEEKPTQASEIQSLKEAVRELNKKIEALEKRQS